MERVAVDALSRRKRSVSQPRGKGFKINERDERLLYALRAFGPAPQPLLFHVWRGEEAFYEGNYKKRMTNLFHERAGGGPYVMLCDELSPPEASFSVPRWLEISPEGKQYLEDFELGPKYVPPKRDADHHRGMGACLDISFIAEGPQYGIGYQDQSSMFAHERCPDATRKMANPLKVKLRSGAELEPDRLFTLHYRGQGYRFFAREDCRGTESLETLKQKIRLYCELLRTGAFRKQWGLTNLRVMFALTLPGRIDHLKEFLQGNPYAEQFIFKAFPMFSTRRWTTPRKPLAQVYEPWETPSGYFDITKLNA